MEAKAFGGGEVRKLHIIYFLSHMGRAEHPHLIRVHHLTRSGVYLRDVKRWFADLRGKEMPDAYSWSYKRRYKTGYVWQDLLDDDLITPLSDNEYVLKGSEIVSTIHDIAQSYPCVEKKAPSIYKEQPIKAKNTKVEEEKEEEEKSKMSSEISEELPSFESDRSSLTEEFDSMKIEEETKKSTKKFEIPSLYRNLPLQGEKKMKKNESSPFSSSSFSPGLAEATFPAKRKSFSGGASNMFRNMISCGGVDTNDSVLVMLNRSSDHKTCSYNNSTTKEKGDEAKDRIFKGDKFGGSARVFGTTCWDQQEDQNQAHWQSARRSCDEGTWNRKQQQSQFTKQKPIPAAYRPVGEPTCSQCGKRFKPEKMHCHMKSCRGMKALAKNGVPAAFEKKISQGSMAATSHNDSVSGYFLTN
ncbi:hypothetical protein UlMin_004725 [Ulmus minor]